MKLLSTANGEATENEGRFPNQFRSYNGPITAEYDYMTCLSKMIILYIYST